MYLTTMLRYCASRAVSESLMNNISGGTKQIVVRSLSWETGKGEVADYFRRFGAIERARISYNYGTGFSRGVAFVSFQDAKSAEAALSAKEHVIDGRKVFVKYEDPEPPERNQGNARQW